MKKFILPLLLLGLLAMAVWRGSIFFRAVERSTMLENKEDLIDLSIKFKPDNQQLNVTLAKSEVARAQGLGDRATLVNDGMLFAFPRSDRWQFWMKGMQFGLDFVWIQNDRIVGITSNVPAPDIKSSKPNGEVVSWSEPINFVLELPAGKAQELGLKVDDVFQFVENPK